MATTARTTGSVEGAPPTASDALADRRLRRVWDAVSRPDVKVVSTDVFDTLLWRQVAEPVFAFPLAAERLRERGLLDDALSPAGFGRLREEAEKRARELLVEETGRVEVTLGEVYALMPQWLFARGGSAEIAMQTELEVERDLLVPDLDVLAVLLAAQQAGKLAIAVSDTYFTEDHLRFFLRQPLLRDLELDRIFVSSAHRVGKSGGLFEIVLRELGVAPEEVVHMGDNEEADVEFPSKLGITCTPFDRHPDALKRIMGAEQRHRVRAPLFARRGLAGTSAAGVAPDVTSLRGKVAAREENAGLPTALQPFWEYGSLVHGPVMTGFAEWVQERAAALGVHRLHGFMREGGFLGDLVNRAGEYLGTDIRCTPLWLNREVLSAASIGEASPEELAPLLVRRRAPTVARFLASIGLGPEDLPRFASHAQTSLDDYTTRTNLLTAISEDERLRARVLDHARAARGRVVRYVERELEGDGRLVCVDLGWAGSAQGLLSTVLKQAGVELEVAGLYLALHAGASRRVFEGQRAWGFLGEYGWPGEAVSLLVRSPEILEQICMPGHGSQVALGEDLEPVLDAESRRDPVQAAEADAVRKGVRAFQREWARYQTLLPGKVGSLGGSAELLRPILIRSVVAPTEQEAALLGRWMHDENQGSTAVEAVADAAVAASLRHMDPAGLRDLPMSDLYWPFGVAAQVDSTWAELIDAAAAGLIPWEALSGEADTGPFTVRIERGVDADPEQEVGGVPVRNRFGLSAVHGTLRGGAVQELVIRPSEFPAVVRFDHLELRCHVQGRDEPEVIRLEAPQDFAALRRVNCFVLNPNLFVVHSNSPALYIDLTERVAGHVFRVDVRAGFAVMAIGELLPTPGRVRNVEEAGVRVEHLEQVVRELESSLSWRITKPLRLFKRVFGR